MLAFPNYLIAVVSKNMISMRTSYSQGIQIIRYENSRYPYLKYSRVLWKYKMSVVSQITSVN